MRQDDEVEKLKANFLETIGEDPMGWTRLRPELLPYYEESGGSLGWPMLRHPLVYSIPFGSWKMANEMFERKTERVKELMAEGNYSSALWYYERPYRLTMLMLWWKEKRFDLEGLREMLPTVWIDTEHPKQFGYAKLVKLFRTTGFLTDMPGLEEPYPCTVYRGCLPIDKRGISWTLLREKATWFAHRLNEPGKGRVYEATVPAEAVLAVFTGRGEAEVLVDPKYLTDEKELA
jgi:hypothetical protein